MAPPKCQTAMHLNPPTGPINQTKLQIQNFSKPLKPPTLQKLPTIQKPTKLRNTVFLLVQVLQICAIFEFCQKRAECYVFNRPDQYNYPVSPDQYNHQKSNPFVQQSALNLNSRPKISKIHKVQPNRIEQPHLSSKYGTRTKQSPLNVSPTQLFLDLLKDYDQG